MRPSDHLTLHMIELPKADRLALLAPEPTPVPELAPDLAPLAARMTFFGHWREVEHMSTPDYAPVNEALEELKKISADERERYRPLSREMALRDEVTLRNAAVRKAKPEGNADILAHLLMQRFGPLDEAVQYRLNHATAKQLLRWTDRILSAPTLSAVFDGH